jgi:hypothetical protein
MSKSPDFRQQALETIPDVSAKHWVAECKNIMLNLRKTIVSNSDEIHFREFPHTPGNLTKSSQSYSFLSSVANSRREEERNSGERSTGERSTGERSTGERSSKELIDNYLLLNLHCEHELNETKKHFAEAGVRVDNDILYNTKYPYEIIYTPETNILRITQDLPEIFMYQSK